MDEEQAFLNAIAADPENDLPRLVYADWLDEHDRPDMAEFIRLQCELEPNRDLYEIAGVTELHQRERDLWESCIKPQTEKVRRLFDGNLWIDVQVRRGFVATVGLNAADFIERGSELLATCPTIQRVKLFRVNGRGAQLANCEHLADFPELELACWYSRETAGHMAASRNLHLLRKLTVWLGGDVSSGTISSADLIHLFVASPAWPHLRELVLFDAFSGENTARLATTADWVAGRTLARVVTPGDPHLLPFAPGFAYFCPGKLPDGRRIVAKPLDETIHVIVFGDDHRVAERYDIPHPLEVAEHVRTSGTSIYAAPYETRQAIHRAVGSVSAFIRVYEGFEWPDGSPSAWGNLEFHYNRWSALGIADRDDDPETSHDPWGYGGAIDWLVSGGQYGCGEGWCDKTGQVHST